MFLIKGSTEKVLLFVYRWSGKGSIYVEHIFLYFVGKCVKVEALTKETDQQNVSPAYRTGHSEHL